MQQIEVGDKIRVNEGTAVPNRIGDKGTLTSISYERNRVLLEIQFDSGDLIVVDSRHINFDKWSEKHE